MNRDGQQRDMVFCHQCENEWFRDEHGLICPQCHSEFTEIIEPEHDPRADQGRHHDEGGNDQNFTVPGGFPPGHLLHGHYPFAPDPDEDDIEQVHWISGGPGRGSLAATLHNTDPPRGQGDGGPRPQNNSIFGMFSNLLHNIGAQDVLQNLRQQTQQQAQQHQGEGQGGSGNQEQPGQRAEDGGGGEGRDPGRPRSAPGFRPGQEPGGPNIRIIHGHGPLGAFTVTSSVSGGLFPRDANNPQARNQQVEGLQAVLDQMFGGGMGAMHFQPGAQGQANLNPFAIMFNQLFNPAAAASGDAVFTQEAFDRVISQLMEQNTTGNAPGPATETAIAALPKRKLEMKDLGEEGKAECTICMDTVEIGEEITVLPCGHWFHGECVASWLREHDTCPHCRKGIMPKQGEGQGGQAVRSPDQEPLHNMDPFSGGTGGLQTGSRENPVTVPDGPEAARQQRESFRRHSSHMTQRVESGGEGGEGGGGMGIAERVRRAWTSRTGGGGSPSGSGSGSGNGSVGSD